MGRVGPAQRGLLRVAHQHHRLGCRATVADLYPTQPGGGGVPHPQKRTIDAAHLASARGPGAGPYLGVLSGLRLVEDPGVSGKAAPGWATVRGLSSMNLAASRVPMWCCRWPRIRAASYAFAA